MRTGLALALGLLWVGTPWPLQALMGLAFASAAGLLCRRAGSGRTLEPALALLAGAWLALRTRR